MHMLMTAATVLAAFATATVAAADPIAASSPDFGFSSNAPGMVVHPLSDDDTKSDTVGLALSIGGSLAGPALFALSAHVDNNSQVPLIGAGVAAMAIGPSLGHWYAGDADIAPLLVRAAGGAILVAGVADGFCLFTCTTNQNVEVGIGIFGGGALILGSTLYDMATAPRAVHRHNEQHRVDFQVVPIVSRTSAGNTTGVTVGGSF